MAENTKIEWADHTFNPWIGCTKISPACDHCYAEGWAKRYGRAAWGAGNPRQRTSTRLDDLTPMVRVGKKAAGRLLDGREWNEVPE